MTQRDYSEEEREEAAIALSCCASSWTNEDPMALNEVVELDSNAYKLAVAAFDHVFNHYHFMSWPDTYAEAEALVRTGWTP